LDFATGKSARPESFSARGRELLVRTPAPATVPPMSFQEVKNIEGEVARLDKLFVREKDWDARRRLAKEIMGHCRRLAELEKRAFVSAKVHPEEWIARLEREQELCVLRPLEEKVAALAKVSFSAEGYEARKHDIEGLLASIIEQQQVARDSAPYRALLERLWQISVSEDENFESLRKLSR
jgi:hypothetical protein